MCVCFFLFTAFKKPTYRYNYRSYLCHFRVRGFIWAVSSLELLNNIAVNILQSIFYLKLFSQNKFQEY